MSGGFDIISMLAGVISAITAVLGMYFKMKYDEKKSKEFNYDPSLHDNIVSALDFVMEETEADRVYILEFHNGEHYFSGRSQQKLSCTHEVVSEGISAESHNLQNIRISNFHCLIKSIANGDTFKCPELQKFNSDIAFKSFLESKGVKSLFARPVKTLNGKTLGIIALEYVKENRVWSEDAEGFVRKQARIISGYLI
jgi:GAF domain-containing protein